MKLRGLFNLGSATFLAVSSLFSQILGFLRDKLLSYIYGAGTTLDAYYASFRIPEFMYLSIGSFVSSAILVPLFAKKLKEDDARIWFQKLFTTFLVFFLAVYGIIVIFLPKIISKLYKHNNFEFQHSVVLYGSVLLVSTFFLSLSSIISSVAQERRDFIRVGLAPVFYNLGTVLGILILRPFWGITGVCIGVVVGSMMHMFIQMPQVKKMGLFVGYKDFLLKAFSFDLLIKTLNKSLFRTISLAASAVVFFLLTYFASKYEAGVITIVSIAFSIQTVFHTLLGVSYATAILPALSDAYVKSDEIQFNYILKRAFKKIFLFSFVITGLVFLFKTELIYILFGGGKFNEASVVLTGVILGAFVISLYAQNMILIISRAAYARNDYFLPLIVNVLTAILTYVLASLGKNIFNSSITIPVAFSFAQYTSFIIGLKIYRSKNIKERYLSGFYMFKTLVIIIITTFCSNYLLNFILTGKSSILIHIIYSFIIFAFYMMSTYVLLGLLNDENIKEDRRYFKNSILKVLLAIFPVSR